MHGATLLCDCWLGVCRGRSEDRRGNGILISTAVSLLVYRIGLNSHCYCRPPVSRQAVSSSSTSNVRTCRVLETEPLLPTSSLSPHFSYLGCFNVLFDFFYPAHWLSFNFSPLLCCNVPSTSCWNGLIQSL